MILYSVQCCYAVHWTDNYYCDDCLFTVVAGPEGLRPQHGVHDSSVFSVEQSVLSAGCLRGTVPSEVLSLSVYAVDNSTQGSFTTAITNTAHKRMLKSCPILFLSGYLASHPVIFSFQK